MYTVRRTSNKILRVTAFRLWNVWIFFPFEQHLSPWVRSHRPMRFVVLITWKCHWNFPFFKSWYLKVTKKYAIPVEFNHVQFHVKIPPLHGPPLRHVAVVTGRWVVVSDVLCHISFRMEWQPFTLLPYMVRQRLYRSFSLGLLILPRSLVRWGTNNCYSSLCDFLTFLQKLTDWWAWKMTILVSLYDKLFDDLSVW